jgi:uncharacterized protein YodC (DUF2158 family)
MSNTKFEIGNKVVLKSGKRHMTISSIDEINGIVECVWEEDGEFKSAKFPIHTIELVYELLDYL